MGCLLNWICEEVECELWLETREGASSEKIERREERLCRLPNGLFEKHLEEQHGWNIGNRNVNMCYQQGKKEPEHARTSKAIGKGEDTTVDPRKTGV